MELMDTDFDYPIVSPGHSISQAWLILGACCQSSNYSIYSERLVLVTNNENQLEGVINLETFFKSMDPGALNVAARVPGGGPINEANYMVAYLLPNRRVEEIMLPVDKIALKSTDTVNKAFFILLNNDVGILPVLNIFKHVIGIVHAADVFHVLGLSSSFCKLAFMGYDYSRHGAFNADRVSGGNHLKNELPEKKQKPRVCSLQKFNPKMAIIALLVGLMLSPLFTPEMTQTGVLYGKGKLAAQVSLHHVSHGLYADEAGTMATVFNSMVARLQCKTVKLPPDMKELSASGQEMTNAWN